MGESIAPGPTRRFRIAGMSNGDCAARVERALRALPGVESATVDLDASEVALRVDPAISEATLAAAVEEAGYTLVLASGGEPDDEPEYEPSVEPEPEEPEPRPAYEPVHAPDLDPVGIDEPEGWRAWLPSWSTLWYVGSRIVVAGFAASLLLTVVYRFLPVPFTLLMVGESIEGRTIRQQWVPLERISPHLIRAVIAAEDGEFCRHWGFDLNELQQAWEAAQDGGRLRGASTITQQTAKNVFLWSGRSWARKGLEAYFTLLIEGLWPKRRTIEVYLNVIEWGPGIFGAEAASRRWFGKPASALTRMEAARLAAILPSPKSWRANPPGPYVARRGSTIAARANSVNLNGADRCARP
jgi:monofunctional glycosyltransferase